MLEHDKVRPSLATLQLLADRLRTPLSSLVDAAPPPIDQARAVIQRGESLLRQHRFTEALGVLTAAATAARESRDIILQTRVELGIGQGLAGLRQFDLAQTHLLEGRRLAESSADTTTVATAMNALGFLAFRRRRFQEAREMFQSGIDLLNSSGESESEIRGKLLANLGRAYVELGFPAQAMQCLREGESALRHGADPIHRALLLFNFGVAAERAGSFDEAFRHFEQAEALLTIHENVRLLATLRRSLGMLHLQAGTYAEAERELLESRRLAEQCHDDESTAQALVELARLRARTGAIDEARRDAAAAEALARRIDDEAEVARAIAADAEALRASGRLDTAVVRYGQAIEAFERLGMTADVSAACRDLGYAHLARGEHDAAARQFARSFDLLRQSPAAGAVL